MLIGLKKIHALMLKVLKSIDTFKSTIFIYENTHRSLILNKHSLVCIMSYLIFTYLVVSLTKCINNPSPLQINRYYFPLKKKTLCVQSKCFIDGQRQIFFNFIT